MGKIRKWRDPAWPELLADSNFQALFQSRKVLEERQDKERRLRNRSVTIEDVQYTRGFLDALDYIQNLPAEQVRLEQRSLEAEAKRDNDDKAAGVWPTRLWQQRLQRRREAAP